MSKKILVSAGPTREKIDPVRFVSNRSSGKMGYAIAEAARDMGFEVTLVSGPTALMPPEGVNFVAVESAAEMAEAVKSRAMEQDCIIMTAAVADYRPVQIAESKLKKGDGNLIIEFERTEDILASLGKMKRPGQLLAGFAAETDDLIANALSKLRRKNLDWIVANDVRPSDRGMGADNNAVTMLSIDGQRVEFPLAPKKEIAEKIVKQLFNVRTEDGGDTI